MFPVPSREPSASQTGIYVQRASQGIVPDLFSHDIVLSSRHIAVLLFVGFSEDEDGGVRYHQADMPGLIGNVSSDRREPLVRELSTSRNPLRCHLNTCNAFPAW